MSYKELKRLMVIDVSFWMEIEIVIFYLIKHISYFLQLQVWYDA